MGGLVGDRMLLNAVSVFWCPVKVKAEVLRVGGEPGLASAPIYREVECKPEPSIVSEEK